MKDTNGENGKLLTAYSFLAALNENSSDIYDAVYLPLCKRAISHYAQKHNSGKAVDIQETMKQQYGIVIPIVLVRKLIIAVQKSLSRSTKTKFKFQVMEDGDSFSFLSFVYSDLEEYYKSEQRDVNALKEKFEDFVKSQNVDPATTISFSKFISRHAQSLSMFLSGKVETLSEKECGESFMLHIKFLQNIERNDNSAHKVMIRILIGSIIASYLESEIDLNAKLEKGITYYLDTKIVLQALDLQRAEDTTPITELLRLIQDTGGFLKILNITLDEIQNSLQTAIQLFDKDNPTTTINEACTRRGKSKTWLILLKGQLIKTLKEKLNIDVDTLPEKVYEKYVITEDAKELGAIWSKKLAADHDVAAYLHVRDKRKQCASNDKIVQKAMCWFVTPNTRLYKFNMAHKVGYTNEIVMPEELTSLLFIKNPSKLCERVAKIGLGELIAQTLSEEYPSKELICEFSSVIKHSEANITQEQYELLMCEISHEGTFRIQNLLDIEKTDKKQFETDIVKLLAQYETEQKNSERKRKEYETQQQKEQEQLQNKIDDLSHTIDGLNNKLDEQTAKYVKKDSIQRRLIAVLVGTLIIIVCVVIIFVVYHYFTSWENWLKNTLSFIVSNGGLWGFIGLLCRLFPQFKSWIHNLFLKIKTGICK